MREQFLHPRTHLIISIPFQKNFHNVINTFTSPTDFPILNGPKIILWIFASMPNLRILINNGRIVIFHNITLPLRKGKHIIYFIDTIKTIFSKYKTSLPAIQLLRPVQINSNKSFNKSRYTSHQCPRLTIAHNKTRRIRICHLHNPYHINSCSKSTFPLIITIQTTGIHIIATLVVFLLLKNRIVKINHSILVHPWILHRTKISTA